MDGETNGTCVESASLCSNGKVGVKYRPPAYSMNQCLENCPFGLGFYFKKYNCIVVNANNVCSECYKSCETCFQGANS